MPAHLADPRKAFKTGKAEAKKKLEAFLRERNITFENILGFTCFEYKEKHYRVTTIIQVKKILGIPL